MIKPILVILLLKCSLLREVILKRGRFKESFCVIKAAYGLEGELSLDLLLRHLNNSLTFGKYVLFFALRIKNRYFDDACNDFLIKPG